jgi:SAM-dependent methyltransferase
VQLTSTNSSIGLIYALKNFYIKLMIDNYKKFVGPLKRYDFMSKTQFNLLSTFGLRSYHKLLDFGCGSLRAGKLFIPFLNKNNYFGQDPNETLINKGINKELGQSIINIKAPNFSNVSNFKVGFNLKFDFILAQSIFTHTNKSNIKTMLNSFYNNLKNDGKIFVTILEGKDYEGKEDWIYPNSVSISPKTIKKMFNDANLFSKRLFWFHPAQTWYVLTKKKANLPSNSEIFFLSGGEEVCSPSFRLQSFLGNRLFSLSKILLFYELAIKFKFIKILYNKLINK